jgi:glutamate-5-semialdehyde dehydrogenase
MSNFEVVRDIAIRAREAYLELAGVSEDKKNELLLKVAGLLGRDKEDVIAANKKDLELAKKNGKDEAFIDRLELNEGRILGICKALREVAKLPDPTGKITYDVVRPNGLRIVRKTIALGVIAVIYEARPNVTADAFALCVKAGNAVILRPGSDSYESSKKILEIIQEALRGCGISENAAQILPSSDRELVDIMLGLEDYIDVVVPRGGKSLIKAVSEKSKIPVFKHLDGNCHTYIHKSANLKKALDVLYNAKLRRTGICGATESVLVDRDIAKEIMPMLEEKFLGVCEIRADEESCALAKSFVKAEKQDYGLEYLDNVFSLKIVSDVKEAIVHINKYSSKHTEAILAEDEKAVEEFLKYVDSAIVMHNASTQFADGGEFGLGAEIGISTGRMHARGPVGLEQLVTYKYLVHGEGQVR